MSREWNGSTVWAEFVKTAAESGLITSDLTPDQEYIKNRQKEVATGDDWTRAKKTEDYGVTDGEGKDLIEKAHKEDAQMARAMGKGGLVENIVQQQETDIEVATKMPDGALHGVHASVIRDLVKLANDLEDSGKSDAAQRVDAAIREVRGLPFVSGHLRKEAWVGAAIGILSIVGPMAFNWISGNKGATKTTVKKTPSGYVTTKGTKGMGKGSWITMGLGALALALPHLTSTQEGLKDDIEDLREILSGMSDSTAAQSAAKKIAPFASKFKNINVSTKKGFAEYVSTYGKLGKMLQSIKSDVAKVRLEKGDAAWYTFGVSAIDRLDAKYDHFIASYEKAGEIIKDISSVGQKMDLAAKVSDKTDNSVGTSGVSGLQKILFSRGYKGSQWNGSITGNMDDATLSAAKDLERKLSKDIGRIRGKESDLTGKIVSGGNLVIDLSQLVEIIRLTEKESE